MTKKTSSRPPLRSGPGTDHEDIEVRADGSMLPRAARWLDPELRACLVDAQRYAQKIAVAQASLDEHLCAMRDLGVSWSILGAVAYLSPEGARSRILAAMEPDVRAERARMLAAVKDG